MFQHVEPFEGDPILSLNEDFQRDPRAGKVNLTIGIYFDEQGRIPVLESVRRAEQILAASTDPKPYLPIEGAARFRTAVQHLRRRGTDDLTRVTLMSDGASVYECTSNDEVIDLLQGGQGVFGIAIGGVWREIEGSLAELPSERTVEDDGQAHATDELAARRARKIV